MGLLYFLYFQMYLIVLFGPFLPAVLILSQAF